MDVNFFKNVLYIQYKEDTYINIETKRINSCIKYVKKNIEDNNYFVSCEYRLFGTKNNIDNITKIIRKYLEILKKYNENHIINTLSKLQHSNMDNIEKRLNSSEKRLTKIDTFNFFLLLSRTYIIHMHPNIIISVVDNLIITSYEKSCEFYNNLFISNSHSYNDNNNSKDNNNNYSNNDISFMYQLYFYLKNYWITKEENINDFIIIDTHSYDDFVKKIKTDGYIKNINSKNAKIRLRLWHTTYGDIRIGNCFSCDKIIELNDPAWHCGHIISRKNGGIFELNNLRPICVKCNLDMGIQNMYQYIIYNEKKGYKNVKGLKEIVDYEIYKKEYINSINILNDLENNKKIPINISNWLKKELLSENVKYFVSVTQFIEKYNGKI